MQAGPGWLAAGVGEDEWNPALNCLNFALSSSPDELNYNFNFTVQIRFHTSGVLATKPALIALDEIAQTVDDIIGKIERETLRSVG